MYYDHSSVAAEGPRLSFYLAIIKTRNEHFPFTLYKIAAASKSLLVQCELH